MTDKPILFSAPMVRALIDGRKTMTRRFLKPQPFIDKMGNFCAPDRKGKVWNWGQHLDGRPCTRNYAAENVRLASGDRLWVRETWATVNTYGGPGWAYKADGEFIQPEYDGEDFGAGPSFDYEKYPGNYSMWIDDLLAGSAGHRWTPSIHMPRWASRITLIVTDVRVERLQDITEEDAAAEGVCSFVESLDRVGAWAGLSPEHRLGLVRDAYGSCRQAFWHLWDAINGPGAWEANPWVSVTSFEVRRQNIDQMVAA